MCLAERTRAVQMSRWFIDVFEGDQEGVLNQLRAIGELNAKFMLTLLFIVQARLIVRLQRECVCVCRMIYLCLAVFRIHQEEKRSFEGTQHTHGEGIDSDERYVFCLALRLSIKAVNHFCCR